MNVGIEEMFLESQISLRAKKLFHVEFLRRKTNETRNKCVLNLTDRLEKGSLKLQPSWILSKISMNGRQSDEQRSEPLISRVRQFCNEFKKVNFYISSEWKPRIAAKTRKTDGTNRRNFEHTNFAPTGFVLQTKDIELVTN